MEAFEQQEELPSSLFSSATRIVFIIFRSAISKSFWQRMEDGGRKSFRREELKEEFICRSRADFWFLIWRDSAGSQNAGLTILRISTIIFSVLQSSMVAY